MKRMQVIIIKIIEDDLEEKGLEWDELEEKAAKDDKKHERTFTKDDIGGRAKKRVKKND